MNPRHRHCSVYAMSFDRNVAECGDCHQRWLLDPKRGWQPINRSLTNLIGALL